jgi:hypothetical protein
LQRERPFIIIGYEHNPSTIEVETAINAFEGSVNRAHSIPLGVGPEARVEELIHPEHQQVSVCAQEVTPGLPRASQFTSQYVFRDSDAYSTLRSPS